MRDFFMAKLFMGLFLVSVLTGCADRVPYEKLGQIDPVGFWYGLWHGLIIGFSFVISLFKSDVAIYASYNNGSWYDCGFFLGLVFIFLILLPANNDKIKREMAAKERRHFLKLVEGLHKKSD